MKKVICMILACVSLVACQDKDVVKPQTSTTTVLIVPPVEPLLEPTDPYKPTLPTSLERDLPTQEK